MGQIYLGGYIAEFWGCDIFCRNDTGGTYSDADGAVGPAVGLAVGARDL